MKRNQLTAGAEYADLGVYSSVEKAEEAIERYHKLSGFIDYPKDCFYITECNVDHDSDWIEGFTKE